jgi:hypothetical protein
MPYDRHNEVKLQRQIMDNRSKLDANKIFLDANEILFTGVDAEFTGTVTATDFIGPLNGPIRFEAKNRSGADITEGQAIYISGISGNTPEVGLADASNAATMPAFGLAATDAADNNNLDIVTFGSLKGLKTDYAGWALGDTLYISSTTAGALTNVAHGGEANLIQNIGYVERLHSSNGTIKVGGAGRTNATPNLDDGHVFIGDSSNQVEARDLVIADTTGLQAALDAKNSYPSADSAKVGFLTITQAVDLDTIESNVATNNAKVTYPSADAAAVAALPVGLSGYEARITSLEAKMEFIPKAFGRFTTEATPSLFATSYNVASVSRAATGLYSVVIDTDMTTANYTVIATVDESSSIEMVAMTSTHATTGFNIALRDNGSNLSDASESVSFVVFENNT